MVIMKTQLLRRFVIIVATTAIGACAGGPTPRPDEYSGFLTDYSRLQEAKAADGTPVLRWVSPKLTAATYHKVIIDPVQFHPAPQPTEQVSAEVLTQIRNYFDTALRQHMGESYSATTEPGPGVFRFRPAITGVTAGPEALKLRQYLPIALIFTTARQAAGVRPEQVVVHLEAEAVDSQTNEQLGAVVAAGTGESLKGASDKLNLAHVQPLLDHWAAVAATQIRTLIAGKAGEP